MRRFLILCLGIAFTPESVLAQEPDPGLVLRTELKPVRLALDCTGPEGRPAVIPADYDGALAASSVDVPPRLIKPGPPIRVPSDLVGRAATLVFRFVIDTSGHIEPCTISADEASDPRFVPHAVGMVLRGQFSPGRKDGKAVRVVIEQRVRFN